MNINIDEKAKEALINLGANSQDEYVRIKATLSCGASYYELFTDFKREDDNVFNIDGIKFVLDEYSEKACDNTTILYDKDKYLNGFYIKENK